MNRYRLKLGLCAWMALWTAAATSNAQTRKAEPGVAAPVTRAMKQKQRSARFLARRGIGQALQGSGRNGANTRYELSRYARSPAELLAEARAQHYALAAGTQGGSGNTNLTAPWQPVGPAQVTTAGYGALTGRVSSVAVDPSDPSGNTIYVGTTGGGVWRSANAAGDPASVTFTPLTDTLGAYAATNVVSLSIGAVSVQPGATGVVLAGTGDPNDATDSYYGAGILRSADSGVTWSLITQSSDVLAGGKQDFTFSGTGLAGFAWEPNTNLVVAAVSQAAEGVEVNAGASLSMMGIYYSQDAGKTWYMATIADAGNTVQSNQTVFLTRGNAVTSVVWNPVRQMFYAAVRFHGYYQSPDGINWTRIANQPGSGLTTAYCPSNTGSTGSPACPIFRGALAVQPVTGDMFALTADLNNLDQGLWQDVCALNGSSCSSATVTFANQVADAALEAGNGDTTIPQADYDLYLAAVPSGQDTLLFAGTEDIYKCSLANNCAWRNTTHATTCASAEVAWAQHAIDTTLGAAGLIYFGNDGGLWRTTDAVNQQQSECSADDATHYQNLNSGLGSLAEVENIADDAGNAQNMMVSLGALGTAAATAGAGQAWPQVLDGEGNYAAIDPAAATNWYATSEFGVGINRCTEGSGCDIVGFGQPVIASTQVAGDQQEIPAPWILDPQDSANVIVGTCRVWRGPSTGGSGWSTSNLLSGMLDTDQEPYCDGNAEIRSLAASGSATDAPGTAEQIYAGMAGLLDGGATVPGHIFTASVTTGSGSSTTWTDLFHSPVTNGGAPNGQFNPGGFDISSIYVDPHDPTGQTVYATVQGFSGNGLNVARVYGSTDGGAIWSNLTTNLPNAPANSIVVDPNDANTVYVATDTGVYVTRNISSCTVPSTSCWSVFGTSLPNAPVIQLAALNEGSTSVLRVATYGRGVWEIGLVTAGTAMTTAKATPPTLTFPAQQIGTLSATQTVAIINTGTITLNATQVSITGDFAETDNCANPVLPGDACTVNVTFTPSQTGARTGVLTVYGNISGGSAAGQVTVSLNGTGAPGPAIVLSPQTLSFPETLLGKTATAQDVTISNTGGVTASLTSESVTGDFSITANTCGTSLETNTGCTLSIAYSPTVSGNETGSLKIVDSAGTQTLQLNGMGEAPATDGLAPLSLTFAPQAIGLSGASQQVILTNNGDQELDQVAIQLHGDFSAVNRCGTSLAGHSTCAIVVSFVPTQIGAESGMLTVSDIQRSQTVTLAGTGLPPPRLSPAPVSVDFGTYTVGQTSTVQTVTLTNSGGVPLSNVTTNMSGDFAIAPGLNNCPPTLAVGAQCQVGMVFSPTDAGSRSGSLTVTATELSKPLLVPLTGTGVPASGVSATPSSLDFGSYALGQTSSVQKVTLTNNGGVPLSSLNATVTGDFSISAAGSTCGSTLAVKAQCQIGVVFTPSQGGGRTGTFTLTAAELAKPLLVALSGTGLSTPAISAVPGSISFGNYNVGQTSPVQTVTLTNSGGVPLSNVNAGVTGDFAIPSGTNTCAQTLTVGAQCQVGVVFVPSQSGARAGLLSVSAAELSSPMLVALSGGGEDFSITVSGSNTATITSGQTATFMLSILPLNGSTGTVTLACTGAPQNSTCTINPTSVTLTGQNSATATVTIVTGQAASSASIDRGGPDLRQLALALAVVVPIGFLAGKRRRWRGLMLLGVLVLFVPGCNLKVTPGGETSPTGPTGSTGSTNPTPSGAYTVTVTGTEPGLSHAVALSLTVE